MKDEKVSDDGHNILGQSMHKIIFKSEMVTAVHCSAFQYYGMLSKTYSIYRICCWYTILSEQLKIEKPSFVSNLKDGQCKRSSLFKRNILEYS